jgi:sporulation protein YlmC with PRC-barrel domain
MKAKTLALIAIGMATTLGAQMSQAQSTTPSSGQSDQTASSSSQASANSGVHVKKLIGSTVKSNKGEKLGKLEDVVIDPQTGKATFAIIGQGGILRLGEKRLPVPWQALNLDSQNQVTLNVDKDKLQSAPTVTSSDATDLDNPGFVVIVYKFYEIPTGAGETPSGLQSSPSPSGPDSGSSKSDSGSSKP